MFDFDIDDVLSWGKKNIPFVKIFFSGEGNGNYTDNSYMGLQIGKQNEGQESSIPYNSYNINKALDGNSNSISNQEKSIISGEQWYYKRAQELKIEHPNWTTEQITNKMSEIIWNNNYNELMNDIANSRSPAEREQKIEAYKSQLLSYCISGIDVDNDINYLREVQGVEPQYRLSPTNPAFVDATLSFQDMANGYHLEYNKNIAYRAKSTGEIHPDDLYKFQQQQLVKNEINLENVHSSLDVAGLYPGGGIAPDLANAVLYSLEGNYKEAGLSALAAVPLFGDAVAVARKGSKFAEGFAIKESSKATGARVISVKEYFKRETQANEMYKNIRNSTDDISNIAKNTGMPAERVQRIKNHLFNNEHILGDGVKGKFDASYEISQAWKRLEQGIHTDNDIRLLSHELFESKFEGIFKTDYPTAHNATNQSGRTWTPTE